jgi:hypothetical protein
MWCGKTKNNDRYVDISAFLFRGQNLPSAAESIGMSKSLNRQPLDWIYAFADETDVLNLLCFKDKEIFHCIP